jgi:hypothetical protein
MAVPNTNTFSLKDVVNEFTGSVDDLVHCFSSASNSGFNSTYEGNKDSLYNFRDYELPASLTSFSSSAGSSSQSSVCQYGSINQTYYHDGSNAIPVVGDNVYSDSAGTTGLARNHYKLNALGSYHIQTGGSTVDSTAPC